MPVLQDGNRRSGLQRHTKFTKTYDNAGKAFFKETFWKLCPSSAFSKDFYEKGKIYGIASICGLGGDDNGIVIEKKCR
jgi:hypothetical protein